MIKLFSYYLFYKPYNALSRFGKDTYDQVSISDFVQADPDVYPVGRLDKDSEGLLILTNDTRLNKAILHPDHKLPKKYFVQVEGIITNEAIRSLQSGVVIQIDGKNYHTAPCRAQKLSAEPELPPRNPPIRFRKNVPDSWLQITLTEGKNRQVRKMCAKVGFPVLRLVRTQIGNAGLEGLAPGKSKKLTMKDIYHLLQVPVPEPGTKQKKPKEKHSEKKPLSRREVNVRKKNKPGLTSTHSKK